MEREASAGPAAGERDREPVDELEARIDKALLERPSFSIRARLAVSFMLFFAASAGIAIATWVILSRIEAKLHFLEIADQFNYEILQARRFEKNYLLYATNLDDVLHHTDTASHYLESSGAEFTAAVGVAAVAQLEQHLKRYRELTTSLRHGDSAADKTEIEEKLREYGSQLVSYSEELAGREREKVNTLIEFTKGIPVVFLGLVLLLSGYNAYFLSRHIFRRLTRFMEVCRRIGEGDLSPIMPRHRFRDEFTNLSIALNHMARELDQRQEYLVQSHKLRAVGTLTAGVAHELNNPLNNIMLTAAVLQEDYYDLPDAERVEMIGDLLGQAERASKIVRSLLDFARQSDMATEKLRVADIVSDSVGLASNRLKLEKVKVDISLPGNLPPVNGDRQYLNQVFLNLILNAVEAMPGGGTITFSADTESDPGFVAVHVADTGSGIPPHILKSIFDPFFTTRPTGKGTGLGLSVSLGIIQKHGGDITVTSKVGAGTTFTVLLPALAVPAPLAARNGAPVDDEPAQPQPPAQGSPGG